MYCYKQKSTAHMHDARVRRLAAGWDSRARTCNDRVKVCCVTVTPYPINELCPPDFAKGLCERGSLCVHYTTRKHFCQPPLLYLTDDRNNKRAVRISDCPPLLFVIRFGMILVRGYTLSYARFQYFRLIGRDNNGVKTICIDFLADRRDVTEAAD